MFLVADTHTHKKRKKEYDQKADTLSKSVHAADHIFPNKSLQNASAVWKHMKAEKM